MRILITGGTGFIGDALYQHLRREADAHVWVYSRRTGGDVLDRAALDRAIAGKDVVYHLAACTHVDFSIQGAHDERRYFLDVNTAGTLNVLEACRRYGAKLVHVSTSEVYGTNAYPGVPMTEHHPLHAQAGTYAVSKAAADLLCRMACLTDGQDVVIVRPFNQYGPRQSYEKLIPRFIYQALGGEPLTVYGDGEQRRDYVHVHDTARALWAARDLPAGTVVNVGTEYSYSVNDIALMIADATGGTVRAHHTTPRPGEVRELNGSYRRLHDLTGWRPEKRLEDHIGSLVHWYAANGAIVPPVRGPYAEAA